MRVAKWMALPALGGLLMLSACGPGYVSTSVGVSAQMGPGINIYGYTADQYGDWHAKYRDWTPTVVYESNGQYYPNNVRGARQVQVYHINSEYVLPPRDQEWSKTEKRFDAKRIPTEADYGRARPRPQPPV